jgi:hypothetical protein
MAASVNASIKTMMQSVPETQTDLQKMAISIDNMAQGLGLAPQNAARMSEALLKLSGDASAFAHVPMEQALDALSRGLAGKTKGLLEFGIAISQSDIKQRALAMGLLNTGNELTETGTALAAYSLIMERSSRITGEAARTAEQSGKSFAFLKRDLLELADKVSALVLPTMSMLARGAIDVVNALGRVPDGVTKTIFVIAAIATVVGPAEFALGKLAKAYVNLKSVMTLINAGEVAAGFAALANPITGTIVAVGALTLAVLALKSAWDGASNALVGYLARNNMLPEKGSDIIGPGGLSFHLPGKNEFQQSQAAANLANDPTLDQAIQRQNMGGLLGKNGPTQFNPKDQFSLFAENVNLLNTAFARTVESGGKLNPLYAQLNALQATGAKLAAETAGQFSKQAEEVQGAVIQLQRLSDIRDVILSGKPQQVLAGIVNRPIDVGAAGATDAVDAANKYRLDLATRMGASSLQLPINASAEASIQSRGLAGVGGVGGSVANSLALREELLKLPDGFDAARQAAVDLAEAQRQATEDTSLEFEKIKIKLGPLGSALDGLGEGAQRLVVTFYNSATALAQSLVATIGGSGKGAGTGRAIGGTLGAIGGSFFGPVGTAVGSVVGTGLGGLIGGLFDHNTKAVDRNTVALTAMANAVDKVTASVTNAPEFFKVQQYRFDAAPTFPFLPYDPRRSTDLPGNGPAGWPNGVKSGDTYNVHIQNLNTVASNTKQLLDDLVRQNLKTKGTGTPATFAFAG